LGALKAASAASSAACVSASIFATSCATGLVDKLILVIFPHHLITLLYLFLSLCAIIINIKKFWRTYEKSKIP
jgi:hypothetical protein